MACPTGWAQASPEAQPRDRDGLPSQPTPPWEVVRQWHPELTPAQVRSLHDRVAATIATFRTLAVGEVDTRALEEKPSWAGARPQQVELAKGIVGRWHRWLPSLEAAPSSSAA